MTKKEFLEKWHKEKMFESDPISCTRCGKDTKTFLAEGNVVCLGEDGYDYDNDDMCYWCAYKEFVDNCISTCCCCHKKTKVISIPNFCSSWFCQSCLDKELDSLYKGEQHE